MDTAATTTATAKRMCRVVAELKLEGTSGDQPVQLLSSEPGQLEQVAQDCVLSGHDCLQGWRNNNLSAVLFNLRDEKPQRRKAFLLRWNGISYIPVVPIASCPSRGHQWEEYVSISLTPSHQVIHIGKSPWSPYPSLNEFRQRHPFTQRSPICFNNTKANKYQGWWISVKSLEIVGLCYKGFCL